MEQILPLIKGEGSFKIVVQASSGYRGLSGREKRWIIAAIKPFRRVAGISLDDLVRDTELKKAQLADIEEKKVPVRMTDLYEIIRALAPPNGTDFLMCFNLWFGDDREAPPIEPKILPLVDALNATEILTTFSSCQGHYSARDQNWLDRNFAEVRFRKRPEASEGKMETFLCHIVSRFPQGLVGVGGRV